MKVLFVNSVCGSGSTGRICVNLATEYEKQGDEIKIAYGRCVPKSCEHFAVRIGSEFGVRIAGVKARIFDNEGQNSKLVTKKFLKWASEYNPDVLWLHNIHGYYLNYQMLFAWIKSRPNMQVKWTLHDCWAFTGHCSHFTFVKCDKWKTGCKDCPQKKSYPTSKVFDRSKNNYWDKVQAFTGVNNMTVITPSKWLKNLVEQSFLKDYPVEVSYNTIDMSVFKPTQSDFRKKYGLENKVIVLGVANVWTERKGLSDFIELSKKINNDLVKIVLVGLTKKQIKQMPQNILALERTGSAKELAEIYTASDVYLNLTYEDNYPTTNLEAQACGTMCLTYRTGGSVESVPEENIFEVGDINSVAEFINNGLDY